MREILFRGQTRRKGEKVRMDRTPVEGNWVYGGIFPNNKGGDFAIIYQQEPEIEKIPVYADTVGQYTGLPDKNSKKIFEGDIVEIKGNYSADVTGNWEVYFSDICHDWSLRRNEKYRTCYLSFSDLNGFNEDSAVIGNVYDNPELLKEGEYQ